MSFDKNMIVAKNKVFFVSLDSFATRREAMFLFIYFCLNKELDFNFQHLFLFSLGSSVTHGEDMSLFM